jgi:hypothetical protein
MNDLLRQRITRLLESLDDEKAYQVLDYAEFLTSKYGGRAEPEGLLARITQTVENTMRAGKLPVQAITGTMTLMDSAAKVMKGLAAAGQAVVEEAVKVAEGGTPEAAGSDDLSTVKTLGSGRSDSSRSGDSRPDLDPRP